MADGKVVYQIVGESKQLASDMQKAEGVIRQSVGKWDSIAADAAKAVGVAFAGAVAAGSAALAALGKQGLEYNAQMEKYQTAFTTLLGSAKEAAEIMAQIKEDAAVTPFDVDGLTKAVQLLVAADLEADDARATILALGDAIAATGGGDDELMRMAQNLQQVKNVGTAAAIDIKQFAMAGINIYQVLADYLGITAQQAAEMEVTFEVLQAALIAAADEGGKYFGAMANQSQTLNGAVSNLQDSFGQFTGRVTEGLSAAAVAVVTALSDMLNSMSPLEGAITGIFNAIGSVVMSAIPSIKSGIDTLGEAVGMVIPKIEEIRGMLPDIVGSLAEIVPSSEIISILLPTIHEILGLMIGLLPSLDNALVTLITPLERLSLSTLPEIGLQLKDLITSLIKLSGDLLPIVAGFVGELVATLGDIALSILPSMLNVIKGLLPLVTDIARDILPAVNQLISAILPIIKALFNDAVKPIADVLTAFLPILSEIVHTLLVKMSELIERLSPAVVALFEKLQPLIEKIAAFGKTVLELISGALEPLADMLTAVVGWAIDDFCRRIEPAVTAATWLADVIAQYVITQIEAFVNVVKTLSTIIKQVFEGDIVGAFNTLVNAISDALSQGASKLDSFVSRVKSAVQSVQNAVTAISSAMGSIGDLVTGKISLGELISDTMSTFNSLEAQSKKSSISTSAPSYLPGTANNPSNYYSSAAANSASSGASYSSGGSTNNNNTFNITLEAEGYAFARASYPYSDDVASGMARGN